MSKAIAGAAELAGAALDGVAMMAMASTGIGAAALPFMTHLMEALVVGGISMEAGAIADALTQNRAMSITTRQPAAYRQVIYGEQRVGGVIVYASTTGSHYDQYNMVIVLAGHECDAILNLYLDGRQVHWQGSGPGWAAGPGGIYFGGAAGGGTFIGPGGAHYNFDTLVYCEARYGNQQAGDVIGALTANDPNWAPTSSGSPYLGGCTYVYLKVEYDAAMFPSFPEIKFTVHGKNNIYDPRLDPGYSPTVLARPTVYLNGWGPNEHEGAYEEGVDEGYNWGLNDATTLSYTDPNAAVDGNMSTYAYCLEQHTHQYAGCVWNFGNGSTTGNLYLNVNSSVPQIQGALRSAGVWYSMDAGSTWTEIYNQPFRTQQWDSIELPSTQNFANVQVMAFFDSHDDMNHRVYDIQLADAPQSSTTATGYTTNWALIVADVLTNSDFGLGDTGSVNAAQLIAAANVCDEEVALANGNVEARYAAHWHFDCGTAPGDVLQTLMPAAEGRLSRIGGEWYIWPAYWTGPSATFDESSLTGKVQWQPNRKVRGLMNRVNGTYIAPNYPYNVAGDLYDSNGWYYGTTQNNFPFAFQPTNYPQYAADALHGYGYDVYLTEDNNIPLPETHTQNCILSVAQAQRCAKIFLMRNRQQGTGSLIMNLDAWKIQPIDVVEMTFAPLNWSNTQLEITNTRLTCEKDDSGVPQLRFQVQVQETDASVYEWSTTEELSVYDVPANPQSGAPYTIASPTNVAIASDSALALTVNWTAPVDIRAIQIQIQYTITNSNAWVDAGSVAASTTSATITGLQAGRSYVVQIRTLTAMGADSLWAQSAPCIVTNPATTYVNSPALDLTQPTATTITMGDLAVTFDTGVVYNYTGQTFTIPTPTTATWYYVTISDPSLSPVTVGAGTAPSLSLTCQTSNAFVGAPGNVYVGAINALPTGNTTQILAGGWPAPQTFLVL